MLKAVCEQYIIALEGEEEAGGERGEGSSEFIALEGVRSSERQ